MVQATRKGQQGQFSDGVWKTGLPQRYGWESDTEPRPEKKKIPVEIIDFAEARKVEVPGAFKPEPVKPAKEVKPEPAKPVSEKPIEKPVKIKKDGNRKPKNRKT